MKASSHVIVAAPSVPGETGPMLQIARGLLARGHEVTAVVGSDFVGAAQRTGARVIPLRGAADVTAARAAEFMSERSSIPAGPESLNFDWFHFFVEGVPDEHEILQELLAERPDSALVANQLFLGAWPTALGAPGRRPARWIAVAAGPLVVPSVDATPFGPIPGLEGEEQRRAHLAANAQFAAAVDPVRERLQDIVDRLGGVREVPPLTDGFIDVPDVSAQLSVAAFDFPRSDLSDHVRFVGVLPAPTGEDDWVAPSWWGDLDGDRPVVVVTQGTLTNADLGELVGPTLAALAERDVLVVAALGRDVAGSGLDAPANARLASFVPFGELLPKADVLVTNGGFGGTQQALAAGVPVVVAGLTEDKAMVGARVAFHGAGVNLATQRPTADQIGDAVTFALHDRDVHAAVQRLAAAYATTDAAAAVAQLLETPLAGQHQA